MPVSRDSEPDAARSRALCSHRSRPPYPTPLLAQGDAAHATVTGQTALEALRQTQRLMAAGELAMRLQHSLNNPLAALLAEAQLLELETLPPDHRESVERIIELCRRVIDVVRGLDGVAQSVTQITF